MKDLKTKKMSKLKIKFTLLSDYRTMLKKLKEDVKSREREETKRI